MKIILNIILLSISINVYCQQKIYYNENWKITESISEASFYKVIKLDKNNQPIGLVRDYFITGEIQWEGRFLYFDKLDESKNVYDGLIIWFFKNGKKQRQSTFKDGKENGITTYWYDDGTIARKIEEFKNGLPTGTITDYYEDGREKAQYKYTDGIQTEDGRLYFYNNNKTTILIGTLDNYGTPTGIIENYDKDGNLYEQSNMINGEFYGFSKFIKNGKIIYELNERFTSNINGWDLSENSTRKVYIQDGFLCFKYFNQDLIIAATTLYNFPIDFNNMDFTIIVTIPANSNALFQGITFGREIDGKSFFSFELQNNGKYFIYSRLVLC